MLLSSTRTIVNIVRSHRLLVAVRRKYSWSGGSRRTYKGWLTAGSVAVASSCALGLLSTDFLGIRLVHAEKAVDEVNLIPPERKDLPTFKKEEVKQHGRDSATIWVTYKGGVYDVTNFITSHPGGDKILLAAGGSVEPFWSIYAQHKTKEVMEILEELRIGNLDPNDIEVLKQANTSDPFSADPERHPALIVNQQRPFNAETPPALLIDHFRTPNDLFFVRNHMPVPKINAKTHRLTIDGLGVKRPLKLSVEDLKKNYQPVTITSVVQCAGNRRADMHQFKKTQGLLWKGTAISNAQWTGVRLRVCDNNCSEIILLLLGFVSELILVFQFFFLVRIKDLLLLAGVDPNDPRIKHVHLEGADVDTTGQSYGASIPFNKAMSPETIIAYHMNGTDIPADHGAPLRCVVPGIVGARQVKWLKTIRLSDIESPSHWQQKDYRAFSPGVEQCDQLDWKSVPAIQEYPIQSAFCIPAPGTKISRAEGAIDVAGYAWSGGGRGIIRVEISADGGRTWQSAELEQDPEQDLDHMWAWTFFRSSVKIPDGVNKVELIVKATDRGNFCKGYSKRMIKKEINFFNIQKQMTKREKNAYNTQPETAAGIWNVRGLLHNAWHRVEVEVLD
ncbi:oxidoreductase molybdopterin binding domain protein [Dictyocaulus viviparus]|uniref:sulfite oxidase n=1 Tax=Dictyocaulus viviparus TaxID=29172 RepID=A0A0D8XJJ5_DICVI|nr:oxidoreductase molybdopterin binding domain protein [Dictyocaulus viviparus]